MDTQHTKTVLVLAHTAVLGGSSRSLALVIQHLREMGCRVNLFAPAGPAHDDWKASGVNVIPWVPPVCNWLGVSTYSTYAFEASWDRFLYNFFDLLLLPGRLRDARKALFTEMSRGKIDTVYVNSLALFPLAGLLGELRQKFGFQLVWQIREVLNHKMAGLLYRSIARGIAGAADKIIGISSVETHAFLPYKPVEVLHNSVSPAWKRPPSLPEPDLASRLKRVVMSGAYRPSKGTAEFIEMARVISSDEQVVEFYLYSPHPIPPHYRNLFDLAGRFLRIISEKLSISLVLTKNMSSCVLNNVIQLIFNHSLTFDDYWQMTVYVRADNSGSPWGRDVIEAMWAGVPVVATGTSQEFIIDGVTGFLVPPGDAKMLTERVSRLLKDPELHRSMALASYDRAERLFDPSRYRERLREIFEID